MQRVLDFLPADALLFEPRQRFEDAVGLRRVGVLEVGPPAADPMDLLGRVDHLKVGREGANEVARRLRRELRDELLQPLRRIDVTFPVRDRRAARGLDEIEQRLATLFLDELSDEASEAPDVVPERLVLFRENDVRTDDGLCSSFGHPNQR